MSFLERVSDGIKQIISGNDLETVLKTAAGVPDSVSFTPVSYTQDTAGDFWNLFQGDNTQHYTFKSLQSSVDALFRCPPVSTIIGRKAQAYINGRFWVLNTAGKEATGTTATKLRRLFASPNPIQSFKQFRGQNYYYTNLFGFCPILMVKPTGFTDPIDTERMWNIPPHMLDIKETMKLFYQQDSETMIKEIVLNYNGNKITLNAKDLLFIRDNTASINSMFFPTSRLETSQWPVNNIIGAYESRNVLINYRGALGILSADQGNSQYANQPLTEAQKVSLQADFKKYGLKSKQWQFIITSAQLKWQQMGIATRDLMLFEEVEADTMALCDAFGYPYRLMGSNTNNSLGGSDAKEFKSQLYQDTIIPEAENIDEQLGRYFSLPEQNLKLDTDFTHVPALAKDELQAMNARKARDDAYKIEFDNNLITLNDWRIANGMDPVEGYDKFKYELNEIFSPQILGNETPGQAGFGSGNTGAGAAA